ncbi:hypothetical protein L596_022671 [Steinernema carpocapsae]|uniref:Uncharacterized protein n=1 Tax=Steinernema carpocapsae TaxID=34508 RepID=A0A4U5MMC0_STECR|nr:hypothetical protein L596_022671 [Steinernema carpocapsae]
MVRPQFVAFVIALSSIEALPARLKRQGGAKKESDSLVKNKVVSVNVPIKPSVYSLDLDKMVTFLEAEMNRTLRSSPPLRSLPSNPSNPTRNRSAPPRRSQSKPRSQWKPRSQLSPRS